MMNPFDAVSQPTPVGGSATHAPWAVTMGAGDYVMYVETSKESDMNASYNATNYPSPSQIAFGNYGVPYRGQPSVVYRVPFTVSASITTAAATDYYGYGDPTGKDGSVRPPDATITVDTPGSGGARLQLVSDGNQMYRVRVTIDPNEGGQPPSAPTQLAVTDVHTNDLSVAFVAPGTGTGTGTAQVTGYEVRIRAFDEMTEANFAASMPVTAHVTPTAPGTQQTFELDALLPETDYWIGVRAYDNCHSAGAIAITHVRTAPRTSGSVDACFVATAAYGSILANDVELLRHVRDSFLRTNALGELGVEAYYTFGPAFAGVIGDSELLRQTARAVLAPITARARTHAAPACGRLPTACCACARCGRDRDPCARCPGSWGCRTRSRRRPTSRPSRCRHRGRTAYGSSCSRWSRTAHARVPGPRCAARPRPTGRASRSWRE